MFSLHGLTYIILTLRYILVRVPLVPTNYLPNYYFISSLIKQIEYEYL